METILITGSNGLLGQKLCDKLANHPRFRLIATSKGPDRRLGSRGYIYESLDVTDADKVEALLERYTPATIIHTAAMTNVDSCEGMKEACHLLNVTAVKNLIHACEKYPAHLIHLSTDFIFNGKNGPYREDDEPDPLSYYGQTKLEAENLIRQSSISWTILRTIIVYGVASGLSRSNIVLWAKSALEKGEKINVVNDQFRSPTLAEDLADACVLAAEKKAKGIFHASGKNLMSIFEMVERIADYFRLDKSLITPVNTGILSQPARRPLRTGFVLDKIRRELGFEPHSFEEGLAIIAEQLKKLGN